MLCIHANDANDALAVNDLALVTNFLNGCSDFHRNLTKPGAGSPKPEYCYHSGFWLPRLLASLISIHDPASGQIVGRKLDGHFVSGKNANKVFPHFARNMSEHLMFVFQLYLKHCVRQRLDHCCDNFNGVFFRQWAYFPPLATGIRTFFFWSTISRISLVTS